MLDYKLVKKKLAELDKILKDEISFSNGIIEAVTKANEIDQDSRANKNYIKRRSKMLDIWKSIKLAQIYTLSFKSDYERSINRVVTIKNFKALRHARGYEFAFIIKKTGLSRSTIHRLETGHNAMYESVQKLKEFYELNLDQ